MRYAKKHEGMSLVQEKELSLNTKEAYMLNLPGKYFKSAI